MSRLEAVNQCVLWPIVVGLACSSFFGLVASLDLGGF